MSESSMREDKWRVRALGQHVWGIYAPGWDLNGKPLLMYPDQGQAFRAAASRADFAAIPPVAQEDWTVLDVVPVMDSYEVNHDET
jgi:hypothetical protein